MQTKECHRFSNTHAGSEPFGKVSTLLFFSTVYKSVGLIPSAWKRFVLIVQPLQFHYNRRRQPYCFFRSGQWAVSFLENRTICCPIGQIARWGLGLGLPVEDFWPGFCYYAGAAISSTSWFCPSPDADSGNTVRSNGLGFQFSHVLMRYGRGVRFLSMTGVVHLCPALRVDSRWVSNWHTERKSSRTQQSEI